MRLPTTSESGDRDVKDTLCASVGFLKSKLAHVGAYTFLENVDIKEVARAKVAFCATDECLDEVWTGLGIAGLHGRARLSSATIRRIITNPRGFAHSIARRGGRKCCKGDLHNFQVDMKFRCRYPLKAMRALPPSALCESPLCHIGTSGC